MTSKNEQRRAPRLAVSIPTVVEKLGPRNVPLHPVLVPIYERVEPDGSDIGLKFPASIKDLSTNGCFIAGLPIPLLSRVAFTFPLSGFGQVEALGWVLWRRREDAELPVPNGSASRTVLVKAGFGLLFEAISLDARGAIARMVAEHGGR
ncbi:MAG TPA: PilZ domain-containing protein [Polyangia bacterium]|nr:PilZ domain-containing protein [Polyangia bacterium]